MLTLFVLGLTFGVAAAAQPGPFQTYLVSQTVRDGWRRTLPAAFAPLITDGPIVLVVLLVLRSMPVGFTPLLQCLGGAFLLYLAAGAFRTWRDLGTEARADAPAGRSVLKAAIVNLLNPNPWLSWSLVLGPLLVKGWRQSPSHGLALLAGFYGTLLAGLVATVVLAAAANRVAPRVGRGLAALSAFALIAFAIYELVSGVRALTFLRDRG